MCDLISIKMLKIPSDRKIVLGLTFASAEFLMILILFWLKFDMSAGKRACCIFKQLT